MLIYDIDDNNEVIKNWNILKRNVLSKIDEIDNKRWWEILYVTFF